METKDRICIECGGEGYFSFGDTINDTATCEICAGTGYLTPDQAKELDLRIAITREWLRKFKQTHMELKNMPESQKALIHPRIQRALLESSGSMIQSLEQELGRLKDGR